MDPGQKRKHRAEEAEAAKRRQVGHEEAEVKVEPDTVTMVEAETAEILCACCYEHFNLSSDPVTKLSCGHIFCTVCFTKDLLARTRKGLPNRCMYCRTAIVAEAEHEEDDEESFGIQPLRSDLPQQLKEILQSQNIYVTSQMKLLYFIIAGDALGVRETLPLCECFHLFQDIGPIATACGYFPSCRVIRALCDYIDQPVNATSLRECIIDPSYDVDVGIMYQTGLEQYGGAEYLETIFGTGSYVILEQQVRSPKMQVQRKY